MELYTDNLTLKTVTDNDVREVARMWAFEAGEITADEAQKAIAYMRDNHIKNNFGYIYHLCFAIYEKDKNTIVGWCGLDGKTEGKLHIFYLIDKEYRNKGFATQCAARLLAYAFEEANVPFVNGGCDKENTASFRVMEKIGMEQNAFESNGDPLFYITQNRYLSGK